MLTERDREVISFVEKFKIVKTSQIEQMFFKSKPTCQRRLKMLADDEYLHRERGRVSLEYAYYYEKRPRYADHALKLVDFYIAMKPYEIRRFDIEPRYDKVIPDAYMEAVCERKIFAFFIEVHLSNQGFDIAKYERLKLTWQGTFPRVLIVTERPLKVPKTDVPLYQTTLRNIEYIFK